MSNQHIFVLETAFQDANSAKLTISCPVDKINDIMSIIVNYNKGSSADTQDQQQPIVIVRKPKKIIRVQDNEAAKPESDQKHYPTQTCHTCYDAGVKKFSSYCFAGSARPVRCAKHKEYGMVPVPSRCCQNEGCKKTASYNFQDVAGVIYCNAHKLEGMISKTNKKSPEVSACT